MENEAINEYTFVKIILLENFFKRIPKVNFVSPDYKNSTSINIETQKKDNNLSVLLTVNITSGIKDNVEVEVKVKMLGTFKKNTEITQLDVDTFGKINAPALIFPFIREHIASLSSKAGIPTILLPPVNFIQMAEHSN